VIHPPRTATTVVDGEPRTHRRACLGNEASARTGPLFARCLVPATAERNLKLRSSHMRLHPVRLPPRPPLLATSRPLPSPTTGLPRLPASPFQRAVPTTPADRTAAACVDYFAVHTAFPAFRPGRHPHYGFRGLLRLHSRYGPLDRSTARSGLCHEASARPVARPSRSLTTRSIDNSLGGILLRR
jgi:hypothetical protein